MILINGEQTQDIDIADRGFQYGDGLFETIEIRNSKPVFLTQHISRLKTGCERLNIICPEFSLLAKEISFLTESTDDRAVLKIILTRGSGGRGYQPPELQESTRVLSLYPFPDYPAAYADQGVTIRFCQHRLGLNPLLAGIKHLNRLEQVLARAEWNEKNIQEGLLKNINEQVIEGTMSNLFVVQDNQLYTPKLDLSGVAGIVRNEILQGKQEHQIPCHETTLNEQDIIHSDELFLTNSIIGIWPVKKLDEYNYKPGKITRHIGSWLNNRIQQESIDDL